MGKRHLYDSKHRFDAYPFEAFCCDSWRPVELIKVEDGTMTMQFVDKQYVFKERGPFSNIRLKSRKATLSDCTCYLRPGVDICVLSTPPDTKSSTEENEEPVWLDAKIASIERKPHKTRCECQFYVQFYVNQIPLGAEKGILNKDITKVVELEQFAIHQKLQRHPCEVEHYRWEFAEDCPSAQRSKLFLGKFSSDLTWFLVVSVLKGTSFEVRSVQNKIVYEIRDGDGKCLPTSEKNSNAVNFKIENELLIPFVVPFVSVSNSETGKQEGGPVPGSDPMGLRRSKRRYVQPERFLGCDDISESEIGSVRTGLFVTSKKWKDEEDDVPLALLFHPFQPATFSEKHTEGGKKAKFGKFNSSYSGGSIKTKNTSKEIKSEVANQKDTGTQLAIVPLSSTTNPFSYAQNHVNTKFFGNDSGEIRDFSSSSCYIRDPRSDRKNMSDFEEMDFKNKWKGSGSDLKYQRRRYHQFLKSRKDGFSGGKRIPKRTLTSNMYYEVVRSYMNNIESTIKKEKTNVIHQWSFYPTNSPSPKKACDTANSVTDDEETELEMLWREMELALTSCYLDEDNEGPKNKVPSDAEEGVKTCRHDYKLDEEIGLLCKLCGFVSTEIKDVSPPFMQFNSMPNNKCFMGEDTEFHQTEEEDLEFTCTRPSADLFSLAGKDNVWNLIPDLRGKLHFHQKKAFEFLWRNVAGSLVPALMDPDSNNRGGCVISHTPGAGKTFLIIAFLVSYLKLFPGKRPLVLAPKTTLYTWYKEIIKWEVPIPVYQIHNGRTYRLLKHKPVVSKGAPLPGNDIMHVLDCLDKIRKWHDHPSILIMGYTSFLTLTREDSRMPHRKYMCQVLRQSPGIVVLDEGHNPRSTKSRLRKALMKVETDLRILLSGTLFQNNFGEYFNTLCLARPKFVYEVLTELDSKFRKNKKRLKKTRVLLENRARKFFLEKIAVKINSTIAEERIQGLNMLKNATNAFIDVYEGGSSENLPGLQSYTLLMKSSHIQQDIMERLHKERAQCKRFPLELELLITLGSIHPCLMRTAACALRYFSKAELDEYDKHRLDLRKGSKLKFVVSLVTHCISNKEKVLIFCHNIAPINFLLEIFSNVYGWKKGKEVLVLQGDLELFERGRVMDKFEEIGGASKVLLASITACAEGVSLTAASRVILLDSEWNPSKTKQAISRAFRPGQQKVVYVYQLLATGTLEEEKYDRTTWKEWVSNMIFSEELIEDPSRWQKEKIEDDVLRDIVEEDWAKSFHMIMKNEKASKD